jgi:hypothetical protein
MAIYADSMKENAQRFKILSKQICHSKR